MSARAELAAAIRRVNAAYNRLEEPRPDVLGLVWRRHERAIDLALASGDEALALEAIAAYEVHAGRVLAEEGGPE